MILPGDDPRNSDPVGALLVDLFDRFDHQLDAEAVVDEVVGGAGDRVGEGVVREEPDDRGRQGLRLVVRARATP